MNPRHTLLAATLCIASAIAILSCGSDSPSSPSTSTVTISTVSVVSPTTGAQLADSSQPITLTVNNATTSGKNALVYTFEVATDDQFASKVYSKTGVAQGTDGKTSQAIDKLTSGRGYYWRARAEDSGALGVGSWPATSSFTIGAASKLNAPTAVEPLNGAEQGSARPMFTVRNSTRTGSTGAVTYTFEVSDSSSFTTIIASGSQPENASGLTKWFATTDLSAKTYYWRARGVESGAASANSAAQPFKPHPDEIDLRTVTYTHGPDISSWPVTVTLTNVTQGLGSADEICTYYTHQGEWPAVVFYDEPNVLVEGNQWYLAKINGRWYGVPGEWFRPGVACKFGQSAQDIGHDATADEPMHSWVPRPGELVGYAVSTPARNYPTMMSVDERSQVIIVPWK